MKALSISLALLVIGFASVLATVVELGTVEQPVNLGSQADPSRIPLGPVVVETNHGYGAQLAISEPRPCTHGALAVGTGLELNMNLASAFGIEVVPEDSTEVPKLPVTLKVKDWPVPAYSPYKKEHVLAATLHCLLRSVHAPPATPLKILVDAENPEDAKNLAGFAGTYLTAEAEEQGGPTPVPGTRLASDWRGVTYVVLADAKAPENETLRRPPPVLIPYRIDDGTDELSYDLIPVWAGDTWKEEHLNLLAKPVTLFYDYFDLTTSDGPDINPLSKLGLLSKFATTDRDGRSELTVEIRGDVKDLPAELPDILAAFCHALILTTQPTEAKPLTVKIGVQDGLLEKMLSAFVANEDWKVQPGPEQQQSYLACQFAWDPNERALLLGSVPLGKLEFNLDRPWSVTFPPRPELVVAPDQ